MMNMDIRENRTLGLDLGIASCGWAVIAQDENGGRIVAMGARTWDPPETADKERTPTNQLRRQHRGMRRVIKRRRLRMSAIRRLFREFGLIEVQGPGGLRIGTLDPWDLRAAGLDRKLTGPEMAVALGHIAKHRGFKSNSKRDRGDNAADDVTKMKRAIRETERRLQSYRTVGEMFARDEAYIGRKRNRNGGFTNSVLRDDQAREVALLFDKQRRIGNPLATAELEAAFVETAFFQRPLQDSDNLVGPCPFEPTEKRAARRAPSFERFRLLSRLAALRLTEGREEHPLTPDQITAVDHIFGQQKSISFKTLRKLLALPDETTFVGVSSDDEKNDFVGRSSSAAAGTFSLRTVIQDGAGKTAWMTLLNAPEKLDAIAAIVTFREDIDSIRRGLVEIGLEAPVLDVLMAAIESGRPFKAFKGAAHISAKAARAILPHFIEGRAYSEACAAAGYDHARPPETDVDALTNPIARKAVREALKQVKAVVQEYGLPGAIHVELARELGKSKEEREEIKAGIEKRNKSLERLKLEFENVVGHEPSGREDLLRFELWQEQGGRCLYSDRAIPPNMIVASDNTVQVDHILPWSRSGDDSFVNKTLCFAKANQEKRGATPFEWLGPDAARWDEFRARVESNRAMKGRKKRNYLLKDATVLTEKFRPRNLNDTKYATRLTLDLLARMYPESDRFTGVPRKPEEARKTRRLFARPGALTDRLRRAWGLQGLKKDDKGRRIADDRHHALDALIVAAISESALNQLTRAAQIEEERGSSRFIANFRPPWPGFRDEAHAALREVFVSRAERRRARGEGHAQTVRQVNDSGDGPVVYERKSVDALTAGDLDRIKDPDRNAAMIDTLRDWIAAGKPKDRRPLSPKGDAIAKVRVATAKKLDVLVRDGVAERGAMVRVDVFRRKNRREIWQYFLVPIYPHQVFDAEDWPAPPNRTIQASTDEGHWPEIDGTYEFMWSLYPLSYIEVTKPNGEVIEGYARGVSRSTGALTISPVHTLQEERPGIGARTLLSFRKFNIDRLGRGGEVLREKRTWHGVACT
jgi:CRISPR-associated endonuclease Csn1